MIDRLSEILEGWGFDNNNKPTRMLETMDDNHSKLWECIEKLLIGYYSLGIGKFVNIVKFNFNTDSVV